MVMGTNLSAARDVSLMEPPRNKSERKKGERIIKQPWLERI